MNYPKRLTVWESAKTDLIRASWLSWMLVNNVAWCVVISLGLVELTSPILSVGGTGSLLLATSLIWFGFSIAGAAVGAFAWVVFAFAALASGPVPAYPDLHLAVGMTGWHILVLANVLAGLDAVREEKQRRD